MKSGATTAGAPGATAGRPITGTIADALSSFINALRFMSTNPSTRFYHPLMPSPP